tara:strand:- start:38 stop:1441 length:1404 start_codon:yes stop_codon:yes gene_type:complete
MVEYENPYQDKINNDKKNLVQLKAGTANQQLINAAYLGARKEPPAVATWMNAAESGVTSFTEALDKSNKIKQAKKDEINGRIDSQIETLTTTGFSLGKTYYSAANEYTKKKRQEYLAAEGNPELQNQIKMELNVASQNIGTTKQAIEDIATAWGVSDEESTLVRSGLSDKQNDIIDTVTNDANAVWSDEENTFVWKNPLTEETYTAKQINDIQKIASRDYEGQKTYIDDEVKTSDQGNDYRNGKGGNAFNANMQTHSNLKRINKDNINFFVNGDFTNDGTPTFKEELPNHPAFRWDAENNPIFDALSKATLKNGEPRYPDLDGDPNNFTIDDLPDPTPDDGFTNADKAAAMAQVYNAITDKDAPGYDFNVTKGLIGEYMTLRQEKKFYGGKSTAELKGILPTDYGTTEAYIKAGGNIGYAQEVMGYTWNTDIKNRKGKSTTPKTEGWDIDENKEFQQNFQNNSKRTY